MSKEKTVFTFVLITFFFFLLFFFSTRVYLVYSGNIPGSFLFSEVLAGFLEDAFLATVLALLTLFALSLSKTLFLLLVFPLKLMIVITCYANLQYINFFGENLSLFDFEYIRNLSSVWKFSLKNVWIRQGEILFLILPLLVIFAEFFLVLKTKIIKFPVLKFMIFSSAILSISVLTFWGGGVLKNKYNKLGFHQSNYFGGFIRDIKRLQSFIKASRGIKELKIKVKEKEISLRNRGPLNHAQKELRWESVSLRERPIPLPEGFIWYNENYPFIKIPKRDAYGMGILSGGEGRNRTDLLIKSRPMRNIVFIFLESFRSREIGLFGSPYSLTPNFDALASKSILFKNFYGHSDLTAGAEFSTVCSFYDLLMGVSAMRSQYHVALFSLPEILSLFGYTNYWINSWSADFDNSRKFFNLHGNFSIIDKYAFPKEATKADGHYSDEEIMKIAVETLDKAKKPFFAMILTSTNHIPYQVPNKKFELGLERGLFGRYLNTFHYSDYALGRFFELIHNKDYFKNTLFFIFADTGNNRTKRERKSEDEYFEDIYHIPFLIYDPLEEKGKIIDEVAGQVDIAPTVLDLLGIQVANHFVGQSLLQKRISPSYLSYHGRDDPVVFFSNESLLFRYNLEKENFLVFDRKKGRKINLTSSECQKIISTIREMVTLGDWSIYNDKIWDPQIDKFYKSLYKKE